MVVNLRQAVPVLSFFRLFDDFIKTKLINKYLIFKEKNPERFVDKCLLFKF